MCIMGFPPSGIIFQAKKEHQSGCKCSRFYLLLFIFFAFHDLALNNNNLANFLFSKFYSVSKSFLSRVGPCRVCRPKGQCIVYCGIDHTHPSMPFDESKFSNRETAHFNWNRINLERYVFMLFVTTLLV